MANVLIRVGGKKAVTTATFPATFSTYLTIANANALTIPKNGFVIESWVQNAGTWEPSSVIFLYEKSGVPEAQIGTYWTSWLNLSNTHSFQRILFEVTPE